MDTLDEIIREIMEDPATVLSAEAKNALHGATSSHPWCRGKTLGERVQEVRFATAGRPIHAALRHRLEACARNKRRSEMDVKSYKTEKGVHAAVKRLGMHLMTYEVSHYDAPGSKGYTATFIVDNREDHEEVWNRGFKARLENAEV